jgi:hypothetical protein
VSRSSWLGRLRALAALGCLGMVVFATPARAGDSVDVLEAELSPSEGGSATTFTLTLPGGASCPGDSANDGYRVNSYMVPASVDPTTIDYNGLGPIPSVYGEYEDFRQPLFDIESNSFVAIQTANAIAPGEPGLIRPFPGFDYAVYSPGDLPPGRYHIGVACTLLKEIITVWDTEVVVTEAPDDAPAQIQWTAADTGGGDGTSASSGLAPLLVGGIALAAIAVVLVRRTRTSPVTTSPQEDP